MYTRPASLYPSRTLHRVNTRRASLPTLPRALLHPHTHIHTHELSLSPRHASPSFQLFYIHTHTPIHTSTLSPPPTSSFTSTHKPTNARAPSFSSSPPQSPVTHARTARARASLTHNGNYQWPIGAANLTCASIWPLGGCLGGGPRIGIVSPLERLYRYR